MPTTSTTGKPQLAREPCRIDIPAQRHVKAADTLDDDTVGAGGERFETACNVRELDFDPGLGCGDVRCDRRLEAIRIREPLRDLDAARGGERLYVLVNQTVRARHCTGRHRFHSDGAHASPCECVQQRARNARLADAGVGAGDEERVKPVTRHWV